MMCGLNENILVFAHCSTSRTRNKRHSLTKDHINITTQNFINMHPPTYNLNTGAKISAVGLGTWQSKKGELENVSNSIIEICVML